MNLFFIFLFWWLYYLAESMLAAEPSASPNQVNHLPSHLLVPKNSFYDITFCKEFSVGVMPAAIIILFVSGWMIYQPADLFSSSPPPAYWFRWHQWGTAILLVSLTFHFIYESFIVRASNPMAINQKEVRRMMQMVKNFLGFSQFYPRSGKYHPAQIFFHWVVAGNIFLLILTGMVLWKPMRELLPLALLGLGWKFIFYSRILHIFFSASLLSFLIGHIYFALFIKKNWPEAKSIITGQIRLRDYLEGHSL